MGGVAWFRSVANHLRLLQPDAGESSSTRRRPSVRREGGREELRRINLCTKWEGGESKPSCCNRGRLWTRALGFRVPRRVVLALAPPPLPKPPHHPPQSSHSVPSISWPRCHPWLRSAYPSAKALWVVPWGRGGLFKAVFSKGRGGGIFAFLFTLKKGKKKVCNWNTKLWLSMFCFLLIECDCWRHAPEKRKKNVSMMMALLSDSINKWQIFLAVISSLCFFFFFPFSFCHTRCLQAELEKAVLFSSESFLGYTEEGTFTL